MVIPVTYLGQLDERSCSITGEGGNLHSFRLSLNLSAHSVVHAFRDEERSSVT